MTTDATFTARLERTIKAPIARVRAALTDPAQVAQWFSPGPMTTTVPAMDAVDGGQYEIIMTGAGPDGQEFQHAMTGTFTHVTDTVVAMTMGAPGPDGNMMQTLVTFTLREVDGGTHLVLTQSGFPAQEMADMSLGGWNVAADNLQRLAEATA